jgi:alginate O-acetyltransferase complex protein AlgJ
VRLLEGRRSWLAARNIRYMLVMPPSKCTIYHEYAPSVFSHVGKHSRMDELFEALRLNSRVKVVDVRPAVMRAKQFGALYYRTDSHWNRLGALVASQEITEQLKKWFPRVKLFSRNELLIESYKFLDGDLCALMGLGALNPEIATRIFIRYPRAHFSNNPPVADINNEQHHREPFATEVDDPALPKAVCLRDSFMQFSMMFLSENFRRIAYYWRYDFPVEVIEKEKPDIVIQEITERILARGVPSNPPEVERCAANIQLPDDAPGSSKAQLADVKVAPAN